MGFIEEYGSKQVTFLSWISTQNNTTGEDWLNLNQVEIASKYNCSPATINTLIKYLKSKSLLEYNKKTGYRITNHGKNLLDCFMEIEKKVVNKQNFRYVDVFSGCGGLSLGLSWSGWQGVFAAEINKMAFDTFKKNLLDEDSPYNHFSQWPDWLSKEPHSIEDIVENPDILDNLRDLKGKIDLLAGGPPCQGFSVAGARNASDPRNLLVFKQIKLAEILEPPVVLIENVSGFEKKFVVMADEKIPTNVASEAMIQLRAIGYEVCKVTLNAADFGVPQMRKRVMIFALHKERFGCVDAERLLNKLIDETSIEQRKQLGLPTDRYVNIEEAISDLSGSDIVDDPEFKGYKSSKYKPIGSEYQRIMRSGESREIPNSHRFNKHSEKVVDFYKLAITTQKPGRLSKEFLHKNGIHSNKRFILDTKSPCSTLTTAPEEIIHYKTPRVATLREMARIQSFPDQFNFYGRYTLNGPSRGIDVPRNAQIGNAIPPLMGMGIGSIVKKLLNINENEISQYHLMN